MLIISNWPCASHLYDFEITCTNSPWLVLHLVQFLLLIFKSQSVSPFYHKEIFLFGNTSCFPPWLLLMVIFVFVFKDNLLHCLKMLNNVTLSRNNFEHFPTGPPKQLAAVQVGLSSNLSCLFMFFICIKGFIIIFAVPMRKLVHLQLHYWSLFGGTDDGGEREDLKKIVLSRTPTFLLISYLKLLWNLMCFCNPTITCS